MAVHAITIVAAGGNEYRFVQRNWSTELEVVDSDGEFLTRYDSVALPTGLEIGKGFTVEVMGGFSGATPRNLVVLAAATAVVEMRLDPTRRPDGLVADVFAALYAGVAT